MHHLLPALVLIAQLLTRGRVGIATTFASTNDPGNPNPLCYCTNKVLRDHDLVVAHPILPCGSLVLLYAPRTKKSVVARVLDRGPRRAMIDLSHGTARALGANGYETIVMMPL
jgi:hypothetical protein